MPQQLNFQISFHDLLVWILVGLVAGLIAGRAIFGPGVGIFAALLFGILGAIIGNLIAGWLGISISVAGIPLLSQIVIALFGALILLAILRLLGFGRRRALY